MKKLLLASILVCLLSACNELTKKWNLPSTKGHFEGYGWVYTHNPVTGSMEYVGLFPVYRPVFKDDNSLRIYVDEDETESYLLKKLSVPKTFPGVSEEFGYIYKGQFYVSKNISY